MSGDAGILQLMDDLGKALADTPPNAMFGGGNPAQISAVTEIFKASLHTMLADEGRLAAMLGNYDTPQGNAAFITIVKEFLNRHYALGITEENIAITPGSQTGYFMLFNILAGKRGDAWKKILFPIVPEYIGYVDQTVDPDGFMSLQPTIEKLGDHAFKYHINVASLQRAAESVAAICISRPTNPSGNVVDDHELAYLGALAQKLDVPLIIDNAYGQPFPDVIIPDVNLFWNDHTVLSISLSKIGLPSSRVGIFVGPVALMRALTSTNAIVSLANPSFGQYIAGPLIADDTILEVSQQHIKPYYQKRAQFARQLIDKYFPAELPWRIHAYEGSYFFWLWLEGAHKSSKQLYSYLKARGVIIVPGEYFFPGQHVDDWAHAHECLRLNFARPDKELEAGIPILADAIRYAYEA